MSSQSGEQFYPSYSTCDEVSQQCPVEATMYQYEPNLGGAIFFTALFGLNLVAQLFLGWKSRLWSFTSWLLVGIIFEFAGYIARIMLHNNVWDDTAMRQHLVCLILAPSFVSASISVCFKHIILYLGQRHTKIKAKWYPYVFIGTDFLCILIQVVGGAVSATATSSAEDNQQLLDVGSGLLIAGVAAQVVNMVGCGLIILHFMYLYRKNGRTEENNARYDVDKLNPKLRKNFRLFCWALATSYILVLVRCAYRIPEMNEGWGGPLMQNETTFLILDGTMIALAVSILTIFYPGIWLQPMRRENKAARKSSEKQRAPSPSTP